MQPCLVYHNRRWEGPAVDVQLGAHLAGHPSTAQLFKGLQQQESHSYLLLNEGFAEALQRGGQIVGLGTMSYMGTCLQTGLRAVSWCK